MMYYRLTEGLNSVGKLIPESANILGYIKNPEKDYYLSIYKYTEDQKKAAEERIEEMKDGKSFKRDRGVKGIEDVVTNVIGFDFDDGANIDAARLDTIKTVERLLEQNIDVEDIHVSFSGGKGFSVVVNHDKNLTPEQHKHIAQAIAGDLPTDRKSVV